MGRTHLIIGASAAGVSAANRLRMLCPDDKIIIISAESHLPYNKCFLVDHLIDEKSGEDIQTLTREMANEKRISLWLGVRVTQVNNTEKTVICHNGTMVPYDTLILATGSRPVIPPIKGIDQFDNVHTFHTLEDTHTLMNKVKEGSISQAVVIGGGLSGLECADALSYHGIQTSVIERADRVLSHQINPGASQYIQGLMAQQGVTFMPHKEVIALEGAGRQAKRVVLSSGAALTADLVIIAVGSQPNSEIAAQPKIELYQGAIAVNEYMQTNIPAIYAAGDVIAVPDIITGKLVRNGTWPDAMLQGIIAACHIAGKPRSYPGIAAITSSAFFGAKFAACGPIQQGKTAHIATKASENSYEAYLVENDVLKGFTLIGQRLNMGPLKKAILTKTPFNRPF